MLDRSTEAEARIDLTSLVEQRSFIFYLECMKCISNVQYTSFKVIFYLVYFTI